MANFRFILTPVIRRFQANSRSRPIADDHNLITVRLQIAAHSGQRSQSRFEKPTFVLTPRFQRSVYLLSVIDRYVRIIALTAVILEVCLKKHYCTFGFLIIYIFSLFVLSIDKIVEANESEIIFVDEGNPPFMYKDDNGEVAGFYPVLLNKIFTNMGISLEIKAYPWKRVLDLSSQGKGGVGGIYKNDERLKIYDYSSEVLFLETISVVTLRTNPLLYKSIDDLKGKQIGVIRGWSYGKDFDAAKASKSFTVQEVASDELNLKKLEAGRIDALVGLKLSVLQTARKLGIDEKIVIEETPILVNPTYVVFSKKADKTKVLSQFDAELKIFKENGGFQNLYDQ